MHADWKTTRVGDLLARAIASGRRRAYEALRDPAGNLSAVALIAADPDYIRMLEHILVLPK